MSAASHVTTRASYVSRLRRAFLLRVHPDLFRNHSHAIRHEQSKLVKALSNRLSQADFTAWQSYQAIHPQFNNNNNNNQEAPSSLPYAIQRRDGTLLRHKLPLHQPVDKILGAMADALQQSGASLPPLPADEGPRQDMQQHSAASQDNNNSTLDHSYDVYSNRGRSLGHFLHDLDPHEIARRKASRLDAQAVASQVRRLYQFQAVDATALGWSSASAAILFQRLVDLQAEHGPQLAVESFHPLRLVFTYDDDTDTVDPYGGILHLSPASTQLQWLSHLQLVTPHVLEVIRHRRSRVAQMQKDMQTAWGGSLKWKKGYSCASRDFYQFMVRLTQDLEACASPRNPPGDALVLPEPLVVTVENPLVCRRPVTTRDGVIRLGANMDSSQVTAAIDRLRPRASETVAQTQAERSSCTDLAQQATWLLGLSRLDYRATGILHPTDIRQSLARLVQESHRFKHGLAGHAVGIVGSGHFCHLGDDGTVKIPHDWR